MLVDIPGSISAFLSGLRDCTGRSSVSVISSMSSAMIEITSSVSATSCLHSAGPSENVSAFLPLRLVSFGFNATGVSFPFGLFTRCGISPVGILNLGDGGAEPMEGERFLL